VRKYHFYFTDIYFTGENVINNQNFKTNKQIVKETFLSCP